MVDARHDFLIQPLLEPRYFIELTLYTFLRLFWSEY